MDRLTELAMEMLDDTQATLWGRSYDLSQLESKRAAAEWFAEEVRKLMGAADIINFSGQRFFVGDEALIAEGQWEWQVLVLEGHGG